MSGSRVRLRVGGVTDVGQARSNNQDSLLLGPTAYVVADGMGGHQGGEVASSIAVEAVDGHVAGLERLTVADLVAAVEAANDSIVERSMSTPSLAGMGTTLVGIAIVDAPVPDTGNEETDGSTEELLAIVNVGDSRAYRFSGGELTQISDDHSLVAELVRDGRITPEEAEVHPQRNIVTRALGVESGIGVDDFEVLPAVGDRYLLCSDGLTNEVPEADIVAVLRDIDDPDEAATELVRQANENGGRDNITVLIADVIDDGGLAARAAALVPDAEDFSDSGETTASYDPLPDAHPGPAADPAADPGADGDVASAPTGALAAHAASISSGDAPKSRAITPRSIGFVLLILAVIGGAVWLVNDYATSTYEVTFDSGEVVIREGRDFLWFSSDVASRSGIGAEDLTDELRDNIDSGLTYTDRDAAEAYIEGLRERLAETVPPTAVTDDEKPDSTTTEPESDMSESLDADDFVDDKPAPTTTTTRG